MKMSKKPEQEQQQQQEQEQEQSPLLRILTDDALRLLFAYLIHLVDAFHLGITCHKLNKLYIESCHDRRSLELYRGPRYSRDIRSFHTFKATAADELTKDNHCRVHLPRGPYERTIPASINLFCQLFKSLPNLVSLEVMEESFAGQTIPFVFTALRFSGNLSKRLQALTLAIYEEVGDNNNLIVLAPMEQLPALKHLTLYIGCTFNESTPTTQAVLNSPLLNRVLPQLTSFRLYFDSGNPVMVLRFIGEHFLRFANVQLAAAAAAADPSSSALQIALHFPSYIITEEQWTPAQHRPALASVTSLIINPFFNIENELQRTMLPLLTNLKAVHIDLFFNISDIIVDAEWYPQMLTALAKLPKLETLAIVTYNDVPRWTRNLMPVLSTVRSLSLQFGSTYHVNPVEAFHLAHCFPSLQQISVTLRQKNCEYCDYPLSADDGDLGVFQECAQRLALDLLRLGTGTGWRAQIKLKKLVALFHGRKVRFSSLENLLAGINDYKEVPA